MEEVAETSPKPEGQGAASAALLHLVPQRKFALPPVADDRSMATLPRSRPVGSLSPDPASPLSAGSQRRHHEILPANRKYRSWIDLGQRALDGSGKLPRRTEMRSPRPGHTRKEDGLGRARKRSYRAMTRAPPGSTLSRPDGQRSCESQASPTPDDSDPPARRPDTGPDGDFLGGRRSSWDRPELVESARPSRRGRLDGGAPVGNRHPGPDPAAHLDSEPPGRRRIGPRRIHRRLSSLPHCPSRHRPGPGRGAAIVR